MNRMVFQQRYRGTKWSIICGSLCLIVVIARQLVQYIQHYSLLPAAFNTGFSLLLLFCAFRFYREYYSYIKLGREQLRIAGIFWDRKIFLPDIEQMSFAKNNKNIIYLLMEDDKEIKINLLDLSPKSREDFRKAFYIKNSDFFKSFKD